MIYSCKVCLNFDLISFITRLQFVLLYYAVQILTTLVFHLSRSICLENYELLLMKSLCND